MSPLLWASRLPSSLSQFEEAIGHWRGRRGGDGQSLVDCLQNEAAVEAPSEGAEVAREMFGRDGAVGGQEAVFDVGEHGICLYMLLRKLPSEPRGVTAHPTMGRMVSISCVSASRLIRRL